MIKTLKRAVIITAVTVAALFAAYFALSVPNVGRVQDYVNGFRRDLYDSTYMNWSEPGSSTTYVIGLVDYDMLADRYKRQIPREEYTGAVTGGQIFDIYRRIADANSDNGTNAGWDMLVSTTYGYDMAEGCDGFTVDGKTYRAEHNFDFKPDLLTGEPYISKWMIEIEEVNA